MNKVEVIERILAKREYKCERCKCNLESTGGSLGNPKFRQLHHKKYKKDGGEYSEENLELICLSCHRKQHHGEKTYFVQEANKDG